MPRVPSDISSEAPSIFLLIQMSLKFKKHSTTLRIFCIFVAYIYIYMYIDLYIREGISTLPPPYIQLIINNLQ